MRSLRNLGSLLLLLLVVASPFLRWWNVFGQDTLGGPCGTSAGCRSFYCLHHVLAQGAQAATAEGYCTAPCTRDEDCLAKDHPGAPLRCVVPDKPALDDLPPYGKPAKLCMRAP